MLEAALLEAIFRDANDLVVLLRSNRSVKAANPAFRALVKNGRVGADFMDLVAPAAREKVLAEMVRAAGGQEILLEVPHTGADGNEHPVEYRFFPVEGGMVAGIGRVRSGARRMGEELNRTQAELRAKSRILDELQLELTQVPFIDPVTGVWNRLQVIERLTGEWSRSERYGSPITCLLIDAENVEPLRHSEGPAFADEVLKSVARRLKSTVRDHDIVGRYGGDRFIVLAVHSNAEGARALGNRIRDLVAREPVAVGSRTVPVTLRIGGATNHSEGVEILEDLFTVAESALEDARAHAQDFVVAEEGTR
jgi:diguanylate cyclase (GGDEF)-like protein